MSFKCGVLVFSIVLTAVLRGQEPAPVLPPPRTPEQLRTLATLPPDVQVYEEFRYWNSFQPPAIQRDPKRYYDAFLARSGIPQAERVRRAEIIDTQGRRLEIDRWNRILTADHPTFNTQPNAFLVEMVNGRSKGRALDVGMGQGRNALYLAEQGWDVTGFDPAEQAVGVAEAEAKRRNLQLNFEVVGSEAFAWGKAKWDLIVLSYVTVRPYTQQITESLAPGGLIVLEGFQRDATKTRSIGGGVVYDSNELLHMFDGLRIIRYEDRDFEPDFGPRGEISRVVRLAAQKQSADGQIQK